MPSVTRMSALAYRTFNTVMEHMSIFHTPTFRLSVRHVQVCINVCDTHSPTASQDTHLWTVFAMCTTAPRPGCDLHNSPLATNIGETPIIRKALEDMDKSSWWAKAQDMIRREVPQPSIPTSCIIASPHMKTVENRHPRQIILSNSTRSKADPGRESSVNPFLIVVQFIFVFIRR